MDRDGDQRPSTEGIAVEVRPLVGDDVHDYRAFRLVALARDPLFWTSTHAEEQAFPLARFAAKICAPESPDDRIIGAFERDRLIGVVALGRASQQQTSHKAHLSGMAVTPEAGGRGVGRRLIKAALDYAQALGLRQVTLTVSEDNDAAIHLYRSCGFEEFGRERRAVIVGNTEVTKLHMVCDLDRRDDERRPVSA